VTAVRVRFAPSPTGELHIGGARTALFNYLFARASGGTFILRIDDTDQERSRPEYTEALLNILQWLGLPWDEGPYFQSGRLAEYNLEAARLLEEKKAYHCFCTPEELQAEREISRKEGRIHRYSGKCRRLSVEESRTYQAQGRIPVIRLKLPESGSTVVEDIVRGQVIFENNTLDDFIIVKSNGIPTYNFASVVDDYQMGITHVIRAEEHLSNTPRQQLCAQILIYPLPRYAHVPMILAPDRSKLSKRHGATSVEEFRALGYLPQALVNYLALLGWSPGEEEKRPLSDLIKYFTLEKVSKNAAIYDVVKLTWMNGQYLMEEDPDLLTAAAAPYFEAEGLVKTPLDTAGTEYLRLVVATLRERAKTLTELAKAAEYFYRDDFCYDEQGIKKHFFKEKAAEMLRLAAENIASLDKFDALKTEESYRGLSETLNISISRLINPTRLALTGRTAGPGIFDLMAVLGKEKTLERLEKAAEYIESFPG